MVERRAQGVGNFKLVDHKRTFPCPKIHKSHPFFVDPHFIAEKMLHMLRTRRPGSALGKDETDHASEHSKNGSHIV